LSLIALIFPLIKRKKINKWLNSIYQIE
jgi:hypothetical protein